MPIPHCELAVVSEEKLVGYLLNRSHPVGGPKARWFLSRGFRESEPIALRESLLAHVRSSDDYSEEMTLYGAKYIVLGTLLCPDESQPVIMTVWITEAGSAAPRLVTAYPTGTR